MPKRGGLIAVSVGCALMSGAEWPTDGGNPRRTGWQQEEKTLTKDNVKDMKVLWKLKLDNEPREMHSLFPALLAERVPTSRGPKQIAIVAGSGDNVYGIDVEAGALLWKKHFPYTSDRPARLGGPLCPGGLVVTPVIGPPNASGARTAYAVSGDGRLHSLNVADGEDVEPPANFMPPNGKAYSLNLWENHLYTTTAQHCGGNPNLVYGIDLKDKKVTTYDPKGGGLWGRSGAAIGFDGTLYAPTGDAAFNAAEERYGQAIIAVTLKDLKLKDYYAPSNAAFMWKRDLDMQVTPAVFKYKGRELLVSSSKECRIWLMDAKAIGGLDHRTPLYRTPLMCNEDVNFAATGVWGSMATWEDSKGTRWVLASFWGPVHPQFKVPVSYGPVTRGAVVAHKVEEKNGKTVLTPVWMSRDMDMAEPPVIANGIAFAYGSGESNVQATPELGLGANRSEIRVENSTHATLYALDAGTGKELWSSGDQITSFVHFGALSIANGRLYLGTYDSTFYSFGLPGN